MRALLIDDAARAQAQAMQELAAKKPLTIDQLAALSEGFDPMDPFTRRGRYAVDIDLTRQFPVGFTVTFTMEQQPPGLCRHISVSADGALADPYAICEVLKLFGFRVVEGVPEELGPSVIAQAAERGDVHVYPEAYASGLIAVNIIEPVEPVSLRRPANG